jgi:hypothetical protein
MNKRVAMPVVGCPVGRGIESELVRNERESVVGGDLTREQVLHRIWLRTELEV